MSQTVKAASGVIASLTEHRFEATPPLIALFYLTEDALARKISTLDSAGADGVLTSTAASSAATTAEPAIA